MFCWFANWSLYPEGKEIGKKEAVTPDWQLAVFFLFIFNWSVIAFLEEGMAAHSSILARRTPWTEEPGSLQSIGSKRDRTEETEHVMHYNVVLVSAVQQCESTLYIHISPPGRASHPSVSSQFN